MDSFEERVDAAIREHKLFRPKQPILVAVSGGVDSMVLLHVLTQLCGRYGWRLAVAHINHQLRGRSSLADERLVSRTAQKLRWPVFISRANVQRLAAEQNLSLEMAGRKLRHDFLASTAVRRRITQVALGHHLDDQVELFFLRLFRGTGSQGLSGMTWASPSPANRTVRLVRPLLGFSKSELLSFAAQQQIAYREDASNDCVEIQRNRIRRQLMPSLAEYCPGGIQNKVAVTMDILKAESELIEAATQAWLRANRPLMGEPEPTVAIRHSSNGLFLGWEALKFENLPVAVQRRCIQLQLIATGIEPNYDLIEHLRLRPGRITQVAKDARPQDPSSGFRRVVRQSSGIIQLCPTPRAHLGSPMRHRVNLSGAAGQLEFEGVKFTWRIRSLAGSRRPQPRPGSELFDADKVGPSIVLRHWANGDRFQPSGMPKSVKLQDLFVNQKVPRERRTQLMIGATAAGEIFWVEGLRISERFKLQSDSIRRLHWRWQRL